MKYKTNLKIFFYLSQTHQTFEGGWFHEIYRKYISSGKNPIEDLGDAKQYRIYKDLPDKQTALSSW